MVLAELHQLSWKKDCGREWPHQPSRDLFQMNNIGMSVEARSADLPGQWISIRASQWSRAIMDLIDDWHWIRGRRRPHMSQV